MSSWNERYEFDLDTVLAGVVFWLGACLILIVTGHEVMWALLAPPIPAFFACLPFASESDILRELISSPLRALCCAAFGLAMTSVSFVGDCLVGSGMGPLSMHSCTEGAGIGFVITMLLAALSVCTPIVGILRLAIAALRRRIARIT